MEDQQRELVDLERILTDESMEPIQLSYATIKSITNNFSKDQVIGSGGFGVVYQGTLRKGKVAIKKLSTSLDPEDKQFWAEINCLVRVKHKNVVRFLGYCADSKGELVKVEGRYLTADARHRMLCFEYVPNGSLDRYLRGSGNSLDWNRRYQIIKGICHGLHCLHQQYINHLDLKPQNVLLDIHMEPKITDFGLSRWLEGKSKTFADNIFGTLGYIAPEMITGKEISFKSDIYSLGIMMTELIKGCNMHGTANWNTSSDLEWVQMNKCTEVAQSCIHEDKNKRPTIVELIHNLQEIEIPDERVILVDESGGQGSSMDQIRPSASRQLLDVHPRCLQFPLEPNKSRPFPLHLTNNSAEDSVAFMFLDSRIAVSSSLVRKGVIPPQSTWGIVLHLELKRGDQAVPDKQCMDMVLVRSTIVSQGFSADDITVDMFNKQTCTHDIVLKIIFTEPSHPQPNLLYEFGKLQLSAKGEIAHATTQECPGSIYTELLEIYPLELRFHPRAKMYYRGIINLTNKTDDEITFWIVPSDPARYWSKYSFARRTMPPQSTCALVFSIQDEKYQLPNIESFDILMVTTHSVSHVSLDSCPISPDSCPVSPDQVFKAVRDKGGKAHRAFLFVANNGPEPLHRLSMEEAILTNHFQKMISMDLHPTEPLILTGHRSHVCIWRKIQRQKPVLQIARGFLDATDFVVKFIARKQQVLSGDNSGKINVYTTKLELLHTFTAHGGQVRSLAVHPSHSSVLSSSDDRLIKLWDCDNDYWTCIREFPGHLNPVTQVVFNPKDSNTFASVSCLSSDGPGNVKVWSIDATDPKNDFYGTFKAVAWSATVHDRQYLVAATDGGITQLWDLEKERCNLEIERCVKSFKGRDAIQVVVCHPTLPLIIIGSTDMNVTIWNISTGRLVCVFGYKFGGVNSIGFSEMPGHKRLMIGYETRVYPIQIDLQALAGQH